MTGPQTTHGTLAVGARYRVDWPEDWNETLLIYSRPIPVGPDDPPWPDDDPFIADMVGAGYAVAGSANTIFWPMQLALDSIEPLIEAADAATGRPRHRIGFGFSIGGFITAGIVQRFPGLLSGALPMCGNLAGAISVHNRELDIAFVLTTLLAPDGDLELVRITDPDANLERARALLGQANATPAGRARLALAAAVGNIPGWHDASTHEPATDDIAARFANQVAWYDEVGFLVYFWAREQVERQAGGNVSWNTDTDYGQLLHGSITRDIVEAMYRAADLSLEDDLATLASAPRIEADPAAVEYLERHIVFDGELGGVPVLTVHTDGDGLVTPDNEHAYAEVVRAAGNEELLRQVYVHRGGHCSFTSAEVATVLAALVERVESGGWPDLSAATLNAAAAGRAPELGVLRDGAQVAPAFFNFAPPPFPRRYDARDVKRSSAAAAEEVR